jgi:hypothetical protein
MRDTVYDRYLKFQDLFKEEFPDLDDIRFFRMLGKLETWHYPSKRWNNMELSKEETKIYEWIVNKGYNPGTIYKWHRTLGFNKDIQEKIKNNSMSLNEAKTYPKPFRRLTELESELMYHIKQGIKHYLVR